LISTISAFSQESAQVISNLEIYDFMVYKGTVVHGQNDANVVEYHLWTPKWTDMQVME
jgi:hypothetical protein